MKKKIFIIVVIIVLAKMKGVEFTPEGIERAFVQTVTVCGNALNKIYITVDEYLQQHGFTGGDVLEMEEESTGLSETVNIEE